MRHILLVDIGNALMLSGVLPSVALNAAYNATLTARGGRAPYTYTVSAGTLPAGLYLDPATGIIAGTATASGTASFTVRATDTSGRSVQRSYAITVIGEPAVLTLTGTFAAATVGTAYSSDLTITNGTAPYTLHGGTGVISGALPAGLALSIVGNKLRLSGTPTGSGGTVSFTVAIDSGDGQTAASAQSVAVTVSISYAVWDATKTPSQITRTSGTVATCNTTDGRYSTCGTTTGKSTGKWLFRMKCTNNDFCAGVGGVDSGHNPWKNTSDYLGTGSHVDMGASIGFVNYYGDIYYNQESTSSGSSTGSSSGVAANAWLTVAIDLDSRPQTFKVYAGNTLKRSVNLPAGMVGQVWYPSASLLSAGDACTLDAGASVAIAIPTPLAGQGYNGYWG